MSYRVLSPDGFDIDHCTYRSKKAARAAFLSWRERYAAQGYYLDARWRKIDIADLADCCDLVAA